MPVTAEPADDKQTEPAEPCEVLLDQADSRAEDVVIEPLLLAEAERIAEKAEPEEPTEQVIEGAEDAQQAEPIVEKREAEEPAVEVQEEVVDEVPLMQEETSIAEKVPVTAEPADDKQTEPAEPCEVLLDQADSRAEDVVIEPLLLAEAERIAEKAEPEEPTEQVIEGAEDAQQAEPIVEKREAEEACQWRFKKKWWTRYHSCKRKRALQRKCLLRQNLLTTSKLNQQNPVRFFLIKQTRELRML